MALKLLRGTTAQLQAYTPELGEPVYDIELNKLYVGDGSTPGGVAVEVGNSSIGLDDLTDVTIVQPINSQDSLVWDSNTSNFVIGDPTNLSDKSIGGLSDVDIVSQAPTTGQVLKWNGSAFVPGDDNSVAGTGLVEGATYPINITGNVTGDLTGDVTADLININVGSGEIVFEGINNNDLQVSGIDGRMDTATFRTNVLSVTSDLNVSEGGTLATSTSRGTVLAPLGLQAGDNAGALTFNAYKTSLSDYRVNAGIFSSIDTVTGTDDIPGKLNIFVRDPDGNPSIPVTINSLGVTESPIFKATPYADTNARDAAISSPEAGMIVYITSTNKLQCYNGTSWNDLF